MFVNSSSAVGSAYESNRSSGSRSNHWVEPASRFTEPRAMCFWRSQGTVVNPKGIVMLSLRMIVK